MSTLPRFAITCWVFITLTSAVTSVFGDETGTDALAIDGRFTEWNDTHIVAVDTKGDATAAFDLTRVAARTNGTKLYLHFDIGNEINLQNGADSDGTLRVIADLPRDRKLTIDFRARTATIRASEERHVPWSELGFTCLPTYAAEEYELRMDFERFGVAAGEEINLNFSGSDQLENDVAIVLGETQRQSQHVSLARSATARLRIINLNTLDQGLADARRSDAIKRLLAATDADIFCFEEEREEDKFRDAAPQVVPAKDGQPLNLHWSGGCAIATSLPLQPIPMELDRGAAGLIELAHGNHLVVVSLHLECCGYSGSWEDEIRTCQAEQLAGQIRRLRGGEFGEKAKDAGVVVVGDYNLVGSRQPLDILKTAGLTDLMLRNLGDRAAYTWRGINKEESFWPGRLDLVTYDRVRLKPSKGIVIDTSRLGEKALSRLGLRADDSLASDHLLLVADFDLAP